MAGFLLFPGRCSFVQGGRHWLNTLHLSGPLYMATVTRAHCLLTKLCSFVLKRAKSLVFVQSYLLRETPAGPPERHRRINAKIPSPFLDTATHNDLREGSRVVSPEFVLLLALYLFCYAHVCTCAHERAHVNVCVFSSNLPFPYEPVLSYCAGPFPGLFREIPPCCLPFMS